MNLKRERAKFPINYSISRAILDILLDIGESLPLFESPYQHIRRLHREATGAPGPAMWRYNRAIRYLNYRKLLKIATEGDRTFLKLTKKGKLNGLLQRVAEAGKGKPKKWDEKWRLITWDIPESSHLQRNHLRRFVKNLGFHQLQKSVFIRPHEIPGDAVTYLEESGLIKFIRFMRVDRMDNDKVLQRKFGLQSEKDR